MGIYISGSMIVGNKVELVNVPEDSYYDLIEYIEECDMDVMSLHYDADTDNQYCGFIISDILVNDIDDKWFSDVRDKAAKFKKLTGIEAQLIGIQNVR